MTFDQELKRTFDALTDLIQTEVSRQVRDAVETRAAEPPPERPAEAGPYVAPGSELVDGIRAIDAAGSLSAVLDALTRGVAAHASETAVLLRRSGRWQSWRTVGLDDGADAAALAAHAQCSIVIAGETIGAVYADADVPAIEILTRHASRALESITAFKTARALAHADAEPVDDTNADEDEASARRYARLLVSEIKLYHEGDVVSGRRARDLATRLGGEIARARVLYEQRVPEHVRNRADFFHDELVRTLADGDVSLL
jgi:hypothetical protein